MQLRPGDHYITQEGDVYRIERVQAREEAPGIVHLLGLCTHIQPGKPDEELFKRPTADRQHSDGGKIVLTLYAEYPQRSLRDSVVLQGRPEDLRALLQAGLKALSKPGEELPHGKYAALVGFAKHFARHGVSFDDKPRTRVWAKECLAAAGEV